MLFWNNFLRLEYKGKINVAEIVLKDRYWIDLVCDKSLGKEWR
jgi:hypothetical protein